MSVQVFLKTLSSLRVHNIPDHDYFITSEVHVKIILFVGLYTDQEMSDVGYPTHKHLHFKSFSRFRKSN